MTHEASPRPPLDYHPGRTAPLIEPRRERLLYIVSLAFSLLLLVCGLSQTRLARALRDAPPPAPPSAAATNPVARAQHGRDELRHSNRIGRHYTLGSIFYAAAALCAIQAIRSTRALRAHRRAQQNPPNAGAKPPRASSV